MKFEPHPEKFPKIGEGNFKHAYRIEDGLVQLVMKSEHIPLQMKGLLYLNKIATALFPGKIAQVVMSGIVEGDEGHTSAQIVSRYHEPDERHRRMQTLIKALQGRSWAENEEEQEWGEELKELYEISSSEISNRNDITQFKKKFEETGFFESNWSAQNFVFNEDGSFTFVDIEMPWDEDIHDTAPKTTRYKSSLNFDPEKLQIAINAATDADRPALQSYFERLMQLCREAGFEV